MLLALPLLAGCALLDDLHADDDGSEISYPACFRVDMPPDHAAAFEAALMQWNTATGFQWFAASDPGCSHEARLVPEIDGELSGRTVIQHGIIRIHVKAAAGPAHTRRKSLHEQGHAIRLSFPDNPTDIRHSLSYGAIMYRSAISTVYNLSAEDIEAAARRLAEIR